MSHHRPLLLLAGLLAVLTTAPVRAADPPPDLALVPADAIGFVHIRFGDAMRSEHFKEFRDIIQRAGPKALEMLSTRFTPDPLTLDRVTAYVLPATPVPGGRSEPQPVVIFRMAKSFDAAALTKAIVPEGRPTTLSGVRFIRDPAKDMALRIIDNQTFLICSAAAADRAATTARRDGVLAAALEVAASGNKGLVVAVNIAALPPQAMSEIPPPLRPLAQARLATLTVSLAAEPKIEVRLRYASGEASAAAVQTVHGLVKMGEDALTTARSEMETRLKGNGGPAPFSDLPEAMGCILSLGLIDRAQDVLKSLPLQHEGTDLSLQVAVPQGLGANLAVSGAILPALLIPAVQKVREASGRTMSMNNLKQMALAMHNVAAVDRDSFPGHAIYSKEGKPLLSWRVAILPYIEQDPLYRQFKLDEPWDSDNNKKLIPLMPKVYLDPTAPPAREPGLTHYQILVGGGAAWERSTKRPSIPRTFVDGTSNTIIIAEAADPVIWTKPDDLTYDPNKPLPKFGHTAGQPFLVALADGSVRQILPTISEKTLRAAITAAGGELLGPDWSGGK